MGVRLFLHGFRFLDGAAIFPESFPAGYFSGSQLSGILLFRTFFWGCAVSFIRVDIAPAAETVPCGGIFDLDRGGRGNCSLAGLVPGRSGRASPEPALASLLRTAHLAVPGCWAAGAIRGQRLDHAAGWRSDRRNSLRRQPDIRAKSGIVASRRVANRPAAISNAGASPGSLKQT